MKTLNNVVNNKGYSFTELVKESGLPASTLSDILSGKTELKNCKARTLRKLADGLDVSMEELLSLEPVITGIPDPAKNPIHAFDDPDWFVFTRNIALNSLSTLGEEHYIKYAEEFKEVEDEYTNENYASALYLIGLIDYLCDKNGIPRIERYNKLRGETMKSIIIASDCQAKSKPSCIKIIDAIPQFLKFNIFETPETLKQFDRESYGFEDEENE